VVMLLVPLLHLAGVPLTGPAGEPSLLLRWPALGAALMLAGTLTRGVLRSLKIRPFALRGPSRRSVIVVGEPEGARATLALLWQTHGGLGSDQRIGPEELPAPGGERELNDRLAQSRPDEVVFCAADLSSKRIMDLMEALRGRGAMFKIAQPDHEHIIGPSSIESLNDLFILPEHALTTPTTRRTKRVFDVVLALLMVPLSPLLALRAPGRRLLGQVGAVLRGARTWVGYQPPLPKRLRLPALRPGVVGALPKDDAAFDPVAVMRANLMLAKDYSVLRDLRILWAYISGAEAGRP